MRIKLLTSRCTDLGVQQVGTEIDVPDVEARRMLERGQAEMLVRQPEMAAVGGGPERAVKPQQQNR